MKRYISGRGSSSPLMSGDGPQHTRVPPFPHPSQRPSQLD